MFLRGDVKIHGPNPSDPPRFLSDWTTLLRERRLKVESAKEFPSADQLAKADVVAVYTV